MKLNSAQQQAVEHAEGPLMILAGAGAGKTRVITHRMVHLIKQGTPPDAILALTFTNKAAREMRERVEALINADKDINRPVSAQATGMPLPFVSTFHALGVWLLRKHARELGLSRHFTIFDRADSMRAIKQAIKALGLDPKQIEPRSILSTISRQKGEGVSASEYQADIGDTWNHTVGRVWQEYDRRLNEEGALDFDDLLLHTYRLLRDNEHARRACHARWTHVHIDEYQDTNGIQFALTQLLVSATHNNICVVGDIDQTIYTWRGAHLENLLSFEDTFPNTTVIVLEENYRSTQTILRAANTVIEKNVRRKEKTLFTHNHEGDSILCYSARSEEDEAQFIVTQASKLIQQGAPPRDIAVLYRANFQSRVLEQAFMYAGVPYQVLGTRFFDRKEVKDILSYIRAALNPKGHGDIARIIATPPRGIGKMTLAKMIEGKEHELTPAAQKKVTDFHALLAAIAAYASKERPSDTIRFVIEKAGLARALKKGTEEDQERLENMKELATLAVKYDALSPEEGIGKLLEDAALATDQDSLERNHNAVKLMTIHASKGLEFEYVFITGLEDGLFPHERLDDDADDEEERRLFYVALTRARVRVFLSHALVRTVYGSQTLQSPSPFLEEIDEELIEYVNETSPRSGRAGERSIDLIDF